MSKIISQNLAFSWDYVISLFWDRYPNPHSKHVLTEDVLERRVSPDGKLYTKRLILKQGLGNFPIWLRRFLSGTKELVIEESVIDMRSKRIDMLTRNIGALKKYATVVEYCSYSPSTQTPYSTAISRILCVDSNLRSTIRSPLIYYLSRRYNSSAKASLLGYEYVCNLYGSQTPNVQDSLRHSARTPSERTRTIPRVVMADTGSSPNHS